MLLRRQPHVADRPGAQPVGPEPFGRRVVQRQRGARRGGCRRRGARRRSGRLGADPQRLQRHRRSQADARPRPYTGAFPIELTHRPPRSDHPHRRRRRARARRARRRRRPRSPAARRHGRRLRGRPRRPVDGLRIGVVGEGSASCDVSQPGVDEAVRAAIEQLRGAGCTSPTCRCRGTATAMHVWNVIATEGATAQMIDGNAYGMNYKGSTTPS